jgi:REP element-mobilizing transposase RayT
LASSGARAVFLYTQGQLLSFPVELPGEQTAAVAGCLQAYLSREGHADLVRYLAWTPDPTPDLLYAARFTQGQEEDGQGAALLFDGQVPLSRARSQVHAFVQDLESLDGFPRPPSMAGLLFPSPQPEEASPSGIGAAHDTISAWVREADGAPVASPPLPMDPVEASEEGSPEDGAVLSEPGLPAEQAWIPPEMRASGSLTNRERSPQSDGAASLLEIPSAAAGVTQEISEIRLPVMEAFLASEDVGLPVPVPPVFAIETLPQTKDRLDPVTTNVYNLAYTGLFIPRLPHHFLTRDLADAAGRIFQHICLAYGWRLEALSVRPEYIQWIVRTSPSIAPNTLLKVLRQRSSQVIFETYPDLRQDNPSGDFWAPGYLILSGVHAPSTGLVREFILQTRHRQGIQAS